MGWRSASAAAAVLLLCGAATAAHAQSTGSGAPGARFEGLMTPVAQSFGGDQVPNQPSLVPQPHRSIELDSSGRWGLRLDMEQPSGRPAGWQDVQAGGYVNLNSRVRVGGTVGFGDKFDTPDRITPQDAAAPRVKLETQFKF